MPGKLQKWIRDGWGASVLEVGQLYGLVRARRWKWTAVGGKTAFEVWYVRSATGDALDSVVEVSFKAPDEARATASRKTLRTLLSAHPGWVRSEDLLKTELVLDRYRAKRSG